MAEPTTIRTRFAPSPSGHLHVGGARTALFCWAFAHGRDGRFILRIEDTDQKRSSDAASMAFLEDMKWLGIEWDEGPEYEGCGGGDFGPYFSSDRLQTYQTYAQQLIDAGLAYRAFETPEQLDAARQQAQAEKRNYRYDRASLHLDQQTIDKYLEEDRPYVVRFKLPDVEEFTFRDEVRGELRAGFDELDAFVIIKADGWPTYHFAVTVDDELMGVTHIIRGQEHLSNTFKHVALQDAMGFRRPVYAHVSLIFNPDGSKISKRDKDKALRAAVKDQNIEHPPTLPDTNEPAVSEDRWQWWQSNKDHQLQLDEAERLGRALGITLPEINIEDFRAAGYLPDVLVNYLALLGWSPGGDVEKFELDDLRANFDLDRVIKSPAKFNRDKLLAFNEDAIQQMPPDDFAQRFIAHLKRYHPEFVEKLNEEQLTLLGVANHPRSKTLDNQVESSRFFIVDDESLEYDPSQKAIRKAMLNGDPSGCDHLEALLPKLRELNDWTVQRVEQCVKDYTDAQAEGKLGKVAQPLRIAVSGGTISPAIFETLVILGRQSTINRIEHCLKSMCQDSANRSG